MTLSFHISNSLKNHVEFFLSKKTPKNIRKNSNQKKFPQIFFFWNICVYMVIKIINCHKLYIKLNE